MSCGSPTSARLGRPGSSVPLAHTLRGEALGQCAGLAPGCIPSGVSLSAGRVPASPSSAGPRGSDPQRRRPGGACGALRRLRTSSVEGPGQRAWWRSPTDGAPSRRGARALALSPWRGGRKFPAVPGRVGLASRAPGFPALPGRSAARQAPGHLLKANESKGKKDSHLGLVVCYRQYCEVVCDLTLTPFGDLLHFLRAT